ncbi:MAG: L-glutamine synthetase, partial [Verrucomicrobiales bacterium]|nr:L-glutamine synthetase [Verrucomicrobiales bacterium]
MELTQLRTKIQSGEIDTIVVCFPDIFGRLMGKRVVADYFLRDLLEHGTHGCNYLLTVDMEMNPIPGFKLTSWEQGYGDFSMVPDKSSLRLIPWQEKTALVLCDLHHSNGKTVREAPRSLLMEQLARLETKGLNCKIASELEFFLFNGDYPSNYATKYTQMVPSSDYRIDYHVSQPGRDEPLMRAIRNQMPLAGIPIESSKGEWGKGQHEINFLYGEPLSIADVHVIFKQGTREIAQGFGKSITFMAKFAEQEAGSSCHILISLWKDGNNLFWDEKSRSGSQVFRQFLGGLLKYSPEVSLFFAPTINSYKRYQAASWAPTKMAWAYDNRTVGYRVVGEGHSFRIENRMPGADANPYLAFAGMLAAGMAGIRENLDCGEVYVGNAYVDDRLAALPKSLDHAAKLLETSKMAEQSFGKEVVEFYVHGARSECRAFAGTV